MTSLAKKLAGVFGKRTQWLQMLLACTLLLVSVTACARTAPEPPAAALAPALTTATATATVRAPAPASNGGNATAIFAGGCFWCMEPPYDKLPGVISTTSGYTAGRTANPTYEQVSSGGTGHVEVVKVVYDPAKVSYAKLLDVFWRNIDPTVLNRQFCDVGDMYRSGIYPSNDQQRQLAEASKKALQDSGRFPGGIATEIQTASVFYPAEDYHQDYYLKNPVRYKYYRFSCGRDQRLGELWGKSES